MKKLILSLLACILINTAYSQFIVKGTVTDENGEPIPMATILLKEVQGLGVAADFEGKYSLTVPEKYKETGTLIFSSVGYQNHTEKIKGRNSINVTLTTSKLLDAVIIGGSVVQKKRDIAGSISTVSSETLTRRSGIFGSKSKEELYIEESRESYNKINENGFHPVKSSPVSTFSIDVDNASYSNIRRFLNQGEKPPADAVKIEEMINYFKYNYPQPKGKHSFSINTEYSECPWQEKHKLLHIGLQGKIIPLENIPASNLVFLLDVSGSMSDNLTLLKNAFKLLIDNLRAKDRVAIIVYAGAAGVVLESTSGDNKEKIKEAIYKLEAGGSTAGGQGIELAYKIAKKNFIKDGNNRIILATDGDFNVGQSNENELETLIEEKRKTGIFLTCLGFGMGNYQDSKMETLSQKGNGNYAYIDNLQEAQKVLSEEFGGTLYTIAKDVKIQIEFNPTKVGAYRLIGYENRMLNTEDFEDDKKDAGELGSGHSVTAIYEIIPVGVKSKFLKNVGDLKYQNKETKKNFTKELATVKFRYKKPDGNKSIELSQIIKNKTRKLRKTSDNFRFSASVALFGMILKNSKFKGNGEIKDVIKIAEKSRGKDEKGYRAEFIRLVKTQK